MAYSNEILSGFNENQRLDPPYFSALSKKVSRLYGERTDCKRILLAISSEDKAW